MSFFIFSETNICAIPLHYFQNSCNKFLLRSEVFFSFWRKYNRVHLSPLWLDWLRVCSWRQIISNYFLLVYFLFKLTMTLILTAFTIENLHQILALTLKKKTTGISDQLKFGWKSGHLILLKNAFTYFLLAWSFSFFIDRGTYRHSHIGTWMDSQKGQ